MTSFVEDLECELSVEEEDVGITLCLPPSSGVQHRVHRQLQVQRPPGRDRRQTQGGVDTQTMAPQE